MIQLLFVERISEKMFKLKRQEKLSTNVYGTNFLDKSTLGSQEAFHFM
jgi:hypothetical protein